MNVVHLTGKGKSIGYAGPGYRGFEFVGEELKDIFAAARLVVSRAGANSIFELLALKKPMLLVPLEVGSRGDQILNARSFSGKGWALTLSESTMTGQILLDSIMKLNENTAEMIKNQSLAAIEAVPMRIVEILREQAALG
jgi:UDP-N-acetylglucosamine--N-acetylmuramyl-(pentapeptide) pyrophosphoryl-undecaprenol N-acetylglucosamine transferase